MPVITAAADQSKAASVVIDSVLLYYRLLQKNARYYGCCREMPVITAAADQSKAARLQVGRGNLRNLSDSAKEHIEHARTDAPAPEETIQRVVRGWFGAFLYIYLSIYLSRYTVSTQTRASSRRSWIATRSGQRVRRFSARYRRLAGARRASSYTTRKS
jgi:hypothetical protein